LDDDFATGGQPLGDAYAKAAENGFRSVVSFRTASEGVDLARDRANHPMLVTCAGANRVGAFMMIFRVVDQGWSEEKALEEAVKIGLNSDRLKRFAQDYIASQKRNSR